MSAFVGRLFKLLEGAPPGARDTPEYPERKEDEHAAGPTHHNYTAERHLEEGCGINFDEKTSHLARKGYEGGVQYDEDREEYVRDPRFATSG